MKNTPWLRLYVEVLHDPKVQRLPPDIFKFWINTLCLARQHNGKLPPIEDCAFAFRETKERVSSAFHALQKAGLLETDGETFHPHNWSKRQYKSDTSTDRVNKHRNKQRNVTETRQRQNRAETDSEQKDSPPVSPPQGGDDDLPPSLSDPDPPKVNGHAARSPRGTRRKGRLLPDDWKPTEKDRAYAHEQGYSESDIDALADHFQEYFTVGRGKNIAYSDWERAWQGWVRRSSELGRPPGFTNRSRRGVGEHDANGDRSQPGSVAASLGRCLARAKNVPGG